MKMTEFADKLWERKQELLAKAANDAIRASVTVDEMNERAEALATRQGGLLAEQERLGDFLINAGSIAYSIRIGRDPEGAIYSADLRTAGVPPSLKGFDFYAKPAESDEQVFLERQSFALGGGGSDWSRDRLRIHNGEFDWIRSGRDSADARYFGTGQPNLEALEAAEESYAEAQATLDLVFKAVHDRALNPELAELATVLQQA